MKKSKLTTALAVIGGVAAVCAVAAGVIYVVKKKNGCKVKKYVSCRPDGEAPEVDFSEEFAEEDGEPSLSDMEDDLLDGMSDL